MLLRNRNIDQWNLKISRQKSLAAHKSKPATKDKRHPKQTALMNFNANVSNRYCYRKHNHCRLLYVSGPFRRRIPPQEPPQSSAWRCRIKEEACPERRLFPLNHVDRPLAIAPVSDAGGGGVLHRRRLVVDRKQFAGVAWKHL